MNKFTIIGKIVFLADDLCTDLYDRKNHIIEVRTKVKDNEKLKTNFYIIHLDIKNFLLIKKHLKNGDTIAISGRIESVIPYSNMLIAEKISFLTNRTD